MFKRVSIPLFVAISATLLMSALGALPAKAAQQTTTLSPSVYHNASLSADPTYSTDNNGNQTGLTTDDWLSYYWSVQAPSTVPCPNTTFTGIKIHTDTTVQTEGDPDGVTVTLYGPDNNPVPYSQIISGVDGGAGTIGRMRVTGNPSLAYANLGVAGPLEAIWDISAYPSGSTFVIRISHDAEDGTVDEQTTISQVEAIYDDANCPVVDPPTTSPPEPTSPKTGTVSSILLLIASLTSLVALIIFIIYKKKKQKNQITRV